MGHTTSGFMGKCDPIKEEIEQDAHTGRRLERRRSSVDYKTNSKRTGAIELELPTTIHNYQPNKKLKNDAK